MPMNCSRQIWLLLTTLVVPFMPLKRWLQGWIRRVVPKRSGPSSIGGSVVLRIGSVRPPQLSRSRPVTFPVLWMYDYESDLIWHALPFPEEGGRIHCDTSGVLTGRQTICSVHRLTLALAAGLRRYYRQSARTGSAPEGCLAGSGRNTIREAKG